LQARIGLDELAGDGRRPAGGAVCMAAETEFIRACHHRNDGPGGTDAFEAGERDRTAGLEGLEGTGGMRVVTVRADDVPSDGIDRIFSGAVRLAVDGDGMNAAFLKIRRDVPGRHIAVVTDEAILFRRRKPQKNLAGAGVVVSVSTGATHGGNGLT